MKPIHPNLSHAITGALFALSLGIGGCKSTSGGIAGNPFMAPDRVPPPSTRALLPGQAQPYYQGDPLPPVQTSTQQPATDIAANLQDPNARSSTGRTLAWNTPASGTAPGAAPPPVATQPVLAPTPSSQIVAANEAGVAVPTDADPLRFALPAPQQPAPGPQLAATPAQPPQPIQPPTGPPQQGVLLASYNAPIATSQQPAIIARALAAPPQVNSPWRTPQIAQSPSSPTYITQPNVQSNGPAPLTLPAPPMTPTTSQQVASQGALPTNPMGVTLRPVASPTMPRIRMPGAIEPQVTGSDGFRPRTSMQ